MIDKLLRGGIMWLFLPEIDTSHLHGRLPESHIRTIVSAEIRPNSDNSSDHSSPNPIEAHIHVDSKDELCTETSHKEK